MNVKRCDAWLVVVVASGLTACRAPPLGTADLPAMQLAAAADVIDHIVSNPAGIAAICVAYAGDWDDPDLPDVQAPAPVLAYMDGCREVDGRLLEAGGRGQAISVSVAVPELAPGPAGLVRVFTSTGSVDMAAYVCTVSREGGGWRTDGCELEATS